MRILFLTSVNHPQVRLEAEYLNEKCEVTYIVVPNLERNGLSHAIKCFFKNFAEICILLLQLRIPPFPPLLYLYHVLLTGIILDNKEMQDKKYDLIYAHWLFPAGIIGLILSKILRCKVVSTIRGYDIQVVPRVKKYGIRGSKRIISKFVIEKSDMVIANHKIHKKLAENLIGHASKKITYLPPAIPDISADLQGNPTKELSEIFNGINGKILILYSPSLRPLYGIIEFVKAIPLISNSIKDAIFVIVGEGELKDEAIKLVISSGFEKNVIFVGRVSYESMKLLYKLSSVVCDLAYPGTGTTTLEAFCFGKPVIGIRSPKSVIEHGVNGFLIERGDHHSLAKYVIEILEDHNLEDTLSKNARKTYEEKFSIEKRVLHLFKLFRHIVYGGDESESS